MAEGRSRAAWSHTSLLLCLTANIHRDRKKQPRPFRADFFNPHVVRRSRPVSVERLTREILAVGDHKRRRR